MAQGEALIATSGARLDFAGVPAGSARLNVQALGMGVLSERTMVVSVVPAVTTSVAVDFAVTSPGPGTDGGVPLTSRTFGPTPTIARVDEEVINDAVLVATTAPIDATLGDQLGAAERAVGASIRTVRLERVQLTLNLAASAGVSTLGTLWSGPVEVSVVSTDGSTRVRVATGIVNGTQAILPGLSSQAGLANLVRSGVTVEITGPTSLDDEVPFSAELGVALFWVASSE